MKIILHPPLGIHEQGTRDNNEDCIYPSVNAKIKNDHGLFLVCDGVGGLDKGEVASKIVCDTISDGLSHKLAPTVEDIHYAVRTAEQRFDEYISHRQHAEGMATTLTLLALHEQGATIAHVGDSRVFHFRNGKCIFKTADHSLVNELLSKKIITADEAFNHPQKNVITKAITGTKEPQQADIQKIRDIRDGDYFLMCTDGILESYTDNELLDIIKTDTSNADKIRMIKAKCKRNSKDNFSAYLIQVKSTNGEGAISRIDEWVQNNKSTVSNLLITALAIISGIAIIIFLNGRKNSGEPELSHSEMNIFLDSLAQFNDGDTFFTDQSSLVNDPLIEEVENELANIKLNRKHLPPKSNPEMPDRKNQMTIPKLRPVDSQDVDSIRINKNQMN